MKQELKLQYAELLENEAMLKEMIKIIDNLLSRVDEAIKLLDEKLEKSPDMH